MSLLCIIFDYTLQQLSNIDIFEKNLNNDPFLQNVSKFLGNQFYDTLRFQNINSRHFSRPYLIDFPFTLKKCGRRVRCDSTVIDWVGTRALDLGEETQNFRIDNTTETPKSQNGSIIETRISPERPFS